MKLRHFGFLGDEKARCGERTARMTLETTRVTCDACREAIADGPVRLSVDLDLKSEVFDMIELRAEQNSKPVEEYAKAVLEELVHDVLMPRLRGLIL